MALSSTTTRWDYTGDGSTTDFSYNNKIFEDSDLEVYVDGSLQTLNTNYTVTGAGTDNGGEVKFTSAPANNAEVVIIRSVTNTQESDYPAGGPLSSSTLEDDLDRRTIIDQQQDETFGRSLRIPKSDQGNPTTELPVKADRASKFLKFDSDGNVSTSSAVSLDDADLLTGTDTGSANTYVVSTSASLSSLTDGQILVFRPQNAPTGASTLNVDSTGAKSLVRSDGSAIQNADFAVDQHLVCNYDANADAWVILNLTRKVGTSTGQIPEAENVIRSDVKSNLSAGDDGTWAFATDENRGYRDDGSNLDPIFGQFERVLVRLSSTQSLSNNTEEDISWDAETYDVGDLWDSGSPTLITAPRDGVMIFTAKIQFDANGTGNRRIVLKTGSGSINFGMFEVEVPAATGGGGFDTNIVGTSAPLVVSANDTFKVMALQNSGGSLDVNIASYFSAYYIE